MIAALKTGYKKLWEPVSNTLHQTSEFAKRNETILFWVMGLLYKFALDALYIWVANPLYGYAGLIYLPSFVKYVLGFAMYMILFWYLPRKEDSVAAVLLHIQFAYTIAPMLTFYALGNGSNKYMLMVFCCGMLESSILHRSRGRKNPIYLNGLDSYVSVGIGVLAVVALTIPVIYNGFAGLRVFDFNYIYEMRENATYPPGFTYLFFWMGKAIIPFAVVLLLERKRYGWMMAAIAVQILLYMECGNKYLLFILVPVLAVYLCAKTGHLIKLMYAGLTALFLVLIPAYKLDLAGHHALGVQGSFYIAVRAIFHPADNKFTMFECFSQLPKMFFSDGLIGKMLGLTDLYAGSEGQITYAYNGGTFLEANYNTGYLGEAYAQMGFVGMLLMSVLFALILRAVESYNSSKRFCLLTAVFAMYIINLNDISLLTTLLSSGLAIVLVLLAVYLKKDQEDQIGGV